MDDEQREGKFVNKGLGNASMEHPLPPRPPDIFTPNSATRLPSIPKRDTSTSSDSDMSKATSIVSTIVTLPSQDAVTNSSEPQIRAAKDEATMASTPTRVLEPVMPFWDEKDPTGQSKRQSTASGGVIPHPDRSKKPAERDGKLPLLARIDTTSTPLPPTFPPTPSSQGVVAQQNKWKRVEGSGESSSDSHEMPKSSSAVTNGVTHPLNPGPASTRPPTRPKHREVTKNPGNIPTWNKTTLHNPSKEPPRAPRSMRKQGPPNGPSVSDKAAQTLITPKSELTRSLEAEVSVTLKVEEPATEAPPNLNPLDPPKDIKDFQTVTSTTYPALVPTFINGAAKDGSPLHIKGFPICPQRCEVSLPTALEASHEESLVQGKLGCTHSASIDLPCLSSSLPKEMPLHHFEIVNVEADAPFPMTRVPLGRSFYCQAVGDKSEGHLRWHIITPNNTGRLSKYFAKKGKILESGELVPELDELLEAAKASIPILQCDQGVGDVVYIPPQSWYQVTAVQNPMSLRVWHAYPLKAIIAENIPRDIFRFHRLCSAATPPIRTMLYHHLRSVHESISGTAGTTQIFKNKREEKEHLQDLTDAIKLFDRILAEEYTQGTREEEACLKDAGFCDFCGTDIFHAAFVCSSRFGLWERSIVPDNCCEVRLCPSCCSEGRSCLCGNLRLCTVFDYDELVKLRNDIWSLCASGHGDVETAGEVAQPLTTYDIYEDLRYPHLTLGAISILNIRNSWMEEKYNADGDKLNITCKGGALGCEEHEVSYLQSVTCVSCHETICFKHLLAAGIHGWEAAFRSEHDRNWHRVHSAWSTQWIEWSKSNAFDSEDFLTSLATKFPLCRPIRPASVRLGFYDTANSLLQCAKYEDDPILRWFNDKFTSTDALIPNLELIAPAIKALKTFKRKSETPGAGDSSDGRTVKRKKRNARGDGAFNPKPGHRKGAASKGSKAKSRLGASTPVTPMKEEDVGVDEADTSMDLSASLRLASQTLLLDDLEDAGTSQLEEGELRSSPDTTHPDAPISLDTHMVVQGVSFSGPPSTTISSFEYSPVQSSSVVTPIESLLSAGNKEEMAQLRQQMELLLRANEDLQRKVQELQNDKDLQIQAKDLEITRLAERVSALEAGPPSERVMMSVSPSKPAPADDFEMGSPSSSSKPMDRNPSTRDTESDSESDVEPNPFSLVPY